MRTDAAQFRFRKNAQTRRATNFSRRAIKKTESTLHRAPEQPAVDAVDEAFANLPGFKSTTNSLHAAHSSPPARRAVDRCTIDMAMVQQLAAQLDALDRQRDQLAQLLGEIEAAPVAE